MKSECRLCLAVDIDNVLARAEAEVQRLFQELTGTAWPHGTYGSAGGLDASEIEQSLLEEIFDRFHKTSIPELPLLPGARQVLHAVQPDCRIIIVTARRPYSRPQTLQWLTNHHIPFEALYHTEEKTKIPEVITHAIDDHPHHLERYQELGAKVFVMDQPWNRHLTDPHIVRVTGWDAFLQWWHVRHIKNPWPDRAPETPMPHQLWKRLPVPA